MIGRPLPPAAPKSNHRSDRPCHPKVAGQTHCRRHVERATTMVDVPKTLLKCRTSRDQGPLQRWHWSHVSQDSVMSFSSTPTKVFGRVTSHNGRHNDIDLGCPTRRSEWRRSAHRPGVPPELAPRKPQESFACPQTWRCEAQPHCTGPHAPRTVSSAPARMTSCQQGRLRTVCSICEDQAWENRTGNLQHGEAGPRPALVAGNITVSNADHVS